MAKADGQERVAATDWQRPNVAAPLIVWEYVEAVERIAGSRLAERDRYREALERLTDGGYECCHCEPIAREALGNG